MRYIILVFALLVSSNCYASQIEYRCGDKTVIDISGEKTIEQVSDEFKCDGEWVSVEVTEPSSAEIEAQQKKMLLQREIDVMAQQIVDAMADGDDALVSLLREQRNALKAQIIKE